MEAKRRGVGNWVGRLGVHGRSPGDCCSASAPRTTSACDGLLETVAALMRPPEKRRCANVGIDEGKQSNVSIADDDRIAVSDTSDEWQQTPCDINLASHCPGTSVEAGEDC